MAWSRVTKAAVDARAWGFRSRGEGNGVSKTGASPNGEFGDEGKVNEMRFDGVCWPQGIGAPFQGCRWFYDVDPVRCTGLRLGHPFGVLGEDCAF